MDAETRKRMSEEFSLRMLGEYVTFTGYQWLDLLEAIKPEHELYDRIGHLLLNKTDKELEQPR